jgi:uncharacterized protein YprB with RNaseH-like and TPR domain
MSESVQPDPAPETHPLGRLGEQLQKLGVQRGMRSLLGAANAREDARVTGIESVMPGSVVHTPHGSCFVLERRYPLDHAHGGTTLSALSPRDCPSPALAHLAGDSRLGTLDFGSAIFFDIETTGLGIGVGLVAFLVGLGSFEGNEFCLRQYFLRDYGEELAMLHLVARQMQQLRWWVSFNGRSFDLPVLQTRFICERLKMPLLEAPHLDLLHPARRLWRTRLGSCRLSSLESNLLGLSRESDVPGWLIPDLYFDYLRYGEAGPLRQVFEHNALDILSLVTLAAKANRMLQEPPGEDPEHAIDLYSLGRIWETWRQFDRAGLAYERAVQDRLPPALHQDALYRLSMLHKRSGRLEQAVAIWQTLRERDVVSACVELAKDLEHRRKDYLAASKVVGEALASPDLPRGGPCSAAALTARLARLRQKMGGLPMPHIESYSFGTVTVDGKTHSSDLIILPGGVRAGWWRKEGHRLDMQDLDQIIEAKPSILVIGTGNVGLMKVPQETLDYLAQHGIQVLVERTAAACQRYNELAETEQAAAALHLTC